MEWNNKRILIIRNDLRGDLICTTPVLESLKKKYPDLLIDILTKDFAKDLIDGNPYAHQIYSYQSSKNSRRFWDKGKLLVKKVGLAIHLRKNNYDAVIAPRRIFPTNTSLFLNLIGSPVRVGTEKNNNGRSLFNYHVHSQDDTHEVLNVYNFFYLFKIKYNNEQLWINVDKELKNTYKRYRNHILIHISADRADNEYPLDKFDQIINHFSNQKFIITYAPNEYSSAVRLAKNINCTQLETNIREFIALTGWCTMLIAPDGGVTHFAAAQNIKVISLFGSQSNALRWYPWGNKENTIISHTTQASDIKTIDIINLIQKLIG